MGFLIESPITYFHIVMRNIFGKGGINHGTMETTIIIGW